MMIDSRQLKYIIEATLMAAGDPLNMEQLRKLFDENAQPTLEHMRSALNELKNDYADRAITLVELASGYCFQVKSDYAQWVQRLWEEKPPRYSRALLETLAIIAYRQPITRPEIEAIRGVAVSTNIMKTLTEREWVKEVGHRDLPGKPALYATTKQFLDYFNLRTLDQLPSLIELRSMEEIDKDLQLQLNLQPEDEKVEKEKEELEKEKEELEKEEE